MRVELFQRVVQALRDILGVTGPKYGCGINVCKACTSHLNGRAAGPCSIPVKDLRPSDEVTTVEGLPATVGADLYPMQEAWIDQDMAQCGYCQPGQIMAAVALVRRVKEEGRFPDPCGGRQGPEPGHFVPAQGRGGEVLARPGAHQLTDEHPHLHEFLHPGQRRLTIQDP
ncbi:(2Fe-2S)-binding protein [Streptomyces atrovirens]|uniref:(2Fe-2S)-binding protein n=1 Tax=Streptomyces atrovirens TaxID=285556 RepID=A0ABW0DPZ4_9ACTN